MNKKKVLIVFAVAVLLLTALFVPFKTETYDDGGTTAYTALTYKIVKWNCIMPGGKLYSNTSLYAVPDNFKSLDELWDKEIEAAQLAVAEPGIIPKEMTEGGVERETGSIDTGKLSTSTVKFASRIIRTSYRYSENFGMNTTVIRSNEELSAYLASDKYDPFPTSDSYNSSVQALLKAYDENYFKEQILIVVTMTEGSGSVRHSVSAVTKIGDDLNIEITRNEPEIGTCDMAYWNIFIEPYKGVDVKSVENIKVTTVTKGAYSSEKSSLEVSCCKDDKSITLQIPSQYDYEVIQWGEKGDFMAITIYLDGKEHAMTVEYTDKFGVCGTGLKEVKSNIAGHEATFGYYDNNDFWSFIIFDDLSRYYAIIDEGIGTADEKTQQEAMEILNSLRLGL